MNEPQSVGTLIDIEWELIIVILFVKYSSHSNKQTTMVMIRLNYYDDDDVWLQNTHRNPEKNY